MEEPWLVQTNDLCKNFNEHIENITFILVLVNLQPK